MYYILKQRWFLDLSLKKKKGIDTETTVCSLDFSSYSRLQKEIKYCKVSLTT